MATKRKSRKASSPDESPWTLITVFVPFDEHCRIEAFELPQLMRSEANKVKRALWSSSTCASSLGPELKMHVTHSESTCSITHSYNGLPLGFELILLWPQDKQAMACQNREFAEYERFCKGRLGADAQYRFPFSPIRPIRYCCDLTSKILLTSPRASCITSDEIAAALLIDYFEDPNPSQASKVHHPRPTSSVVAKHLSTLHSEDNLKGEPTSLIDPPTEDRY